MQELYYCKQIQGTQCLEWIQAQPSVLDTLAISKEQAYELSLAICSLLLLSFLLGLLGRFFLKEI